MTVTTDNEIFFQAILSRDRRFDGRFFTAVLTTGIYCRPICPAPTPKFRNVTFYSTAAGAETAGFRPCKRCRPDASPGTPMWNGSSETVSRALQMIDVGFLDVNSVEELASEFGMSDRQLRRLFKNHLGASPNAIALTRRLDFARKLIDETGLPMTDVAFESGFESIRRFNDAVKKRFDRSPTQLRNMTGSAAPVVSDARRMILHLPFRPPLDWETLLGYLKGRRTEGVETIDGKNYIRSIRTPHEPGNPGDYDRSGLIRVGPSPKEAHLELEIVSHNHKALMNIVRRVRRIFDLGADPMFVTRHLLKDPGLKQVVSSFPGLRIPGGWNNFELAIRTIIGQQVSIAGANTITRRLVERCGEPVGNIRFPGITHLFPTPTAIASANLEKLGIPGKRAETLKILAERVANKELLLDGSMQPEKVKEKLMQVPGIGNWTTQYIAMRALREPDAFPGSDLALKREVEKIALNHPLPGNVQFENPAQRPEFWRPWRSYAAVYLWKQYSLTHVAKKKIAKKPTRKRPAKRKSAEIEG